jgi:hypothetical protein
VAALIHSIRVSVLTIRASERVVDQKRFIIPLCLQWPARCAIPVAESSDVSVGDMQTRAVIRSYPGAKIANEEMLQMSVPGQNATSGGNRATSLVRRQRTSASLLRRSVEGQMQTRMPSVEAESSFDPAKLRRRIELSSLARLLGARSTLRDVTSERGGPFPSLLWPTRPVKLRYALLSKRLHTDQPPFSGPVHLSRLGLAKNLVVDGT